MPAFVIQATFADWAPKLAGFARYVESLPDATIDPVRAQDFARSVLDVAIEQPGLVLSLVDRLELQRIARGFAHHEDDLETYALETQLVRREGATGIRLTGLGRVFLRLRGKDAVRWLLTVEVAQSVGRDDRWRASRMLLLEALSEGAIQRTSWEGDTFFTFDEKTLRRLANLRVLVAWSDGDGDVFKYEPQDAMRDVLQAVHDGGPWDVAVAALLADERAFLFQGPTSNASDATIEQSRLIAHEVRNALVPVRHHIDALLASAPGDQRIAAARRGVVRVLTFVDEMVATSDLVDEPVTTLELFDIASEAVNWLDDAARVEIDNSSRIRVYAGRTRLARVLSNVVRNALQATTPGQRVRVSALDAFLTTEIYIDDAGPGVPEDQRKRVFDDGFSTRPGGSGFGLAFARNTVETRFRGKVWCESSELGGARFVISIPKATPK